MAPSHSQKGQDFQGHAPDQILEVRGVVQLLPQVPLNPGEGPVLAAGSGNAKGHRRPGPLDDPVDQAFHKNQRGHVRHHHPKQELQVALNPHVGDQYKSQDRRQGHKEMTLKKIHVLSPRFS